MTKRLFITALLLLGTIKGFAQPDTATKCDLFGRLKFKNGKATKVIKVVYNDIHRSPPPYFIKGKYVEPKMLLKTRIYSGADINFTPEKCNLSYSAPLVIHGGLDVNNVKIYDTVYITTVIFEHYPFPNDGYFFIVTKLSYNP